MPDKPVKLDDTIDWLGVVLIDTWLDTMVNGTYKAQPLAQDWARVSKIGEELGEAIEELISFTGQNPRKHRSKSPHLLYEEIADVAITAILALQHFTKDSEQTRDIIQKKLNTIIRRAEEVVKCNTCGVSYTLYSPGCEEHVEIRLEAGFYAE